MEERKLEQTSTRLRYTEEVASICGFTYNKHAHKYGGFFSVFELERIIKKINEKKELSNKLIGLLDSIVSKIGYAKLAELGLEENVKKVYETLHKEIK